MKREGLGEKIKFAQMGGWSLPDRVRPALTHIAVLLGYLGLTGLFTYPLYSRFGREIIGLARAQDVWQWYWNLWWAKTALLDLFTSPFHTPLLYHPFGVSLYFHTLSLSNCLLSIPLQFLFGPIAAYNSIVVLSFVLSGYFTFLLVDYLVKDKPSAFVSGMIFTFCTFHLWHATGRLNWVALQWLPLYILFLLKAVWEKRDRNAVGAGLVLLVASLTDWSYTLYLLLFTVIVLAYEIWKERSLQKVWGLLRPMVITGLFLILALPVLVPMVKELSRETYAVPLPWETLYNTPDLLSFFVPSKDHFLWGEYAARLRSDFPLGRGKNFMGYSVLALACLSLVDASLRRKARFWLVAALFFFVLALGPILKINGQGRFTDFGLRIPLPPYVILYQLVPSMRVSRYPNRLNIMTMLSLAVLVALGLRFLSSRIAKGRLAWMLRGQLLPILAGTLVVVEFLTAPFPMTKLPPPDPFYATLSHSSIEYGVLDMPVARPRSWRRPRYMYYQTLHGLPIFDGYLSRQPYYPLYDIPGFQRYMEKGEEEITDIVQQGISDLELFQLFRFRYVVIHKDLMGKKVGATMAKEVDAALEGLSRTYESKTLIAYELPLPEEPLAIAMVSEQDNWLALKQEGEIPFRWMASPALIRIYASSPVEVRLSLAIRDVGRESATLLIYSGERLLDSLAVEGGVELSTSALALSQGENLIRLECSEGNVTLRGVGARAGQAKEACLSLSQISLSLLPPE